MGKVKLNLLLKHRTRITIPVVISRYDSKWYMATAPQLDLVTQGRTPEEAKENMLDLLNLYFENPHTPKLNV